LTFSKECVIIILEGGDNIVAKDSLLEMLLEQYRQLDKEQQDEIEFSILNGEELPEEVRNILKELNVKEI
jgi:hypothetical protein